MRNGKTAKLPGGLRDDLNLRMGYGGDGAALPKCLNELPEVQEKLPSQLCPASRSAGQTPASGLVQARSSPSNPVKPRQSKNGGLTLKRQTHGKAPRHAKTKRKRAITPCRNSYVTTCGTTACAKLLATRSFHPAAPAHPHNDPYSGLTSLLASLSLPDAEILAIGG